MNLITLNFTETPLSVQPYASQPKNVVEELVFLWTGILELDPAADYWTDTETRPPLQVDLGPSENFWNSIIEDIEPWETEWGSWETTWTGEPFSTGQETVTSLESQNLIDTGDQSLTEFLSDIEPSRRFPQAWPGSEVFDFTVAELWLQESERTRTGVRNSLSVETQQTDLGNRVVDNFIQPFIRSIDLVINVTNMKPNTKVYVHFDGLPAAISACRPASGNFGDSLITDENGNATIVYRIPPGTFHTGTREVIVSDDEKNRIGFVTTTAKKSFTAIGLGQIVENTIISTTSPETVQTEIQEVENTVELTEWWRVKDPIAQSFFVSSKDGAFLTSVDLFFYEKSSTNGIRMQIREMKDGRPSNVVLPYGEKWIPASEVAITDDSSIPTTFTFDDPVFLMNNVEYCFVVIPDNSDKDYRIWISELGEFDVLSGKRIVEQPNSGILFTSSNDRTWTENQSQDIKHTVNKAVFSTGSTGTLVMEKKAMETFNISEVSGTFILNEEIRGHAKITISNSEGETLDLDVDDQISINGQSYTVLNVSNFPEIEIDAFVIIPSNSSFIDNSSNEWVLSGDSVHASGKLKKIKPTTSMELLQSNGLFEEGVEVRGVESGASATIDNFLDYKIHMVHPIIASFTPTNTKMTWEFRAVIDGTSNFSDWLPIDGNFDNEFKETYLALSKSKENSLISGSKSVQIRANLSSTNNNVSPVIDKSRIGALLTENLINSPADLTTEEYDGEGTALARSITKAITFAEGQDAEDLKVYMTVFKPFVSNIHVFYKILHAEDVTAVEDRKWVEMTPFKNSWDDRRFIEIEFNVPESEKNMDGIVEYEEDGGTFTTFKTMLIKIVLTSENPAIYPIVKDIRAIALQL